MSNARLTIVFESLFGRPWEGGARYLEALLTALGLLDDPPRCLIWGARPEDLPEGLRRASHVVAAPNSFPGRVRRLPSRLARRLAGVPWEDVGLSELARAESPDLWFGFCGFEGLRKDRRLLVWYPDFQHRHHPELFSAVEITGREAQWSYLVRRAQGVLVTSDSVARDALTEPRLAGRVHVASFPPNFPDQDLAIEPDDVRRRYGLPSPYFLVSNQLWRHKNHAVVLRALSLIRQRGQTPPVIAFTGRLQDYRHPDLLQELLSFVHAHGLHEYCRFLGLVPRPEQTALIRGAAVVIQPSLFEGQGAIADEALALGVPLLCSDIPVHRDRLPCDVSFFPPRDEEALASLLQRGYDSRPKSREAVLAELLNRNRAYAERFMAVCEIVQGTPPPKRS